MNEAGRMLLDGEAIDKIDEALLAFGFPIGPIALLDEVGLDIAAKILPVLESELGARFAGPELFEPMLKNGRKGRKSGKGFYRDDRKGRQVDTSVYALLNVTANARLSKEEIAWRCVLPMLNEAVRCIDEHVIHHVRDGDMGAILGLGFPPFLGGPFYYMDQMGLASVVERMQNYAGRFGERYLPCEGLVERSQSQQTFYPGSY